MAETDKDGKETAVYTRGDGLLSMDRDGKIWYYIYDGHGSTRLLRNEAGQTTDRYAYDACGNLLKKEGGTKNDFLTENHPFYVEGKGWCAAAELESGDVLRTQDGETETVEEVWTEQLSEAVRVYNLEIEESHTYYVSVDGVLVHNECQWNKGSFDSAEQSLQYHYEKHGEEVGATSIEQYLRKAEGFKLNLKGAKEKEVDGFVEGVIRYIKNGKFIDLAPDKSVVSFGKI